MPFSLADEHAVMSRQEVAEALHISPARVFQIENRALQKLRYALHQRGLTLDDLIVERSLERSV